MGCSWAAASGVQRAGILCRHAHSLIRVPCVQSSREAWSVPLVYWRDNSTANRAYRTWDTPVALDALGSTSCHCVLDAKWSKVAVTGSNSITVMFGP